MANGPQALNAEDMDTCNPAKAYKACKVCKVEDSISDMKVHWEDNLEDAVP